MGLDISFNRHSSSEVGYFRKVNFLVQFFENKGLNVEEQKPLIIYKEDAEELLLKCEQVLKDKSKGPELLPTREGFFFGSTDYNDYYYDSVLEVSKFIKDKLLPTFDELDSDEFITFDIWY